MKKINFTKKIALVGVMTGMIIASSLVQNFFPKMPQGGTLMLNYVAMGATAIVFKSIFGRIEGFALAATIAFVTSLIIPTLDTNSGIYWVDSFQDKVVVAFLDYLAPYLAMSLLALLPSYKNIVFPSVFLVCFLAFISHYTSGITIWAIYAPEGQAAPIYSLIYNGSYMLLTTVVSLVVIPLVEKSLARQAKVIFG